ncbi:MAG: hypothetical protein MN733_02045 [Nitrososphaera sp.]|nr:hypothetical protein [Nitrososphaera sp.]
MSSAEPSKANPSLSRWHRPRLYATIAAFMQIAVSVVPFLLMYGYPFVEGPIGALFFLIGLNVIYFFFALGVGFFLLDTEPNFIGASLLAIPPAVIIGLMTVSNIANIVGFCSSGNPACDSRIRFTMPWIGFFAAQSFVVAMTLMVWWRYTRKLPLSPAP